MPREKTRQLKILLLKDSISDFDDAVRAPSNVSPHSLSPSLPFNGRIYVQRPQSKKPGWVDFLGSALESSIEGIETRSAAALLIIETSGRKFALTFGFGRNLLEPDSYERDFGLKIVLNAVDADKLRSVDLRTMEDISLVTRRQSSRSARLSTFGIDTAQDLLRAVTGAPRDAGFAKQMAGADALTIRVPIEIDALAAKCDELLEMYNRQDYKEHFEFIDHLRAVKDGALVDELDARLLAQLLATDYAQTHMAPPEPLEWDNVAGFTYSNRRNAQVFNDMDLTQLMQSVRLDPDIPYLKSKQIGVRFRETDQSINKWSAYSCLVHETEHEGLMYVLCAGDWFQIDPSFADSIRSRLSVLPAADIYFPAARPSESELEYNTRAATDLGLALLDRDTIYHGGQRGQVELCDLLSREKQFMHVKRRTRSATLSHLFAQGSISGQLFMFDEDFRNKAYEKVVGHDASLSSIVTTARPGQNEYEVVYAIITTPDDRWPLSLPFFSQLNLVNAAKTLREVGYKVSLALIPLGEN